MIKKRSLNMIHQPCLNMIHQRCSNMIYINVVQMQCMKMLTIFVFVSVAEEDANFDLIFPSPAATANNAKIDNCLAKGLSEVTICFWAKFTRVLGAVL